MGMRDLVKVLVEEHGMADDAFPVTNRLYVRDDFR